MGRLAGAVGGEFAMILAERKKVEERIAAERSEQDQLVSRGEG